MFFSESYRRKGRWFSSQGDCQTTLPGRPTLFACGTSPVASLLFNAATEEYGDLIEWGDIDPTKVVRCALQNAASVAGLLLTTDALIADKPKKKESASLPSGGASDFGDDVDL